jgi:hypothetical protein
MVDRIAMATDRKPWSAGPFYHLISSQRFKRDTAVPPFEGSGAKWRGPIGYADMLNGVRSGMSKLKIVAS